MTKPVIYLDYNSTTPVDPEVLEVMLPYYNRYFGNASSITHAYGWEAEHAVKNARDQVAALINAEPQELIFTSGSTEAINIALQGLAATYGDKRRKIITAPTEHKAVLDTCRALQLRGFDIHMLAVDREGNIDLGELEKSMTDDTLVVCLMIANNETGVIHPADKIGRLCRERQIFFFTDATQAAGKTIIDVAEMNISLMSVSSHKFYGPKGTGALYMRRKNPSVQLTPVLFGGGHEKNLRPGTLNVPGIAGMGKAAEIAGSRLWDETAALSSLRTTFEQMLEEEGNVRINGNIRSRLCNTTNLLFEGIEASRLIKEAPLVAFSTGSACTSAIPEPSHVLKSMGLSDEKVYSSARFSIGRFTTKDDILNAADYLKEAIRNLRK